MTSYGTQTPHTASYVIFKKNDKIAFVLRSNTSWMNGYYGLPSGKVEKDENFINAAIREAKEEVGIVITEANLKHVLTVHRKEGMEWVDVYFEATAYDGELHNAEPHMHSELAWLDPMNLPDNVISSVKGALQAISESKTYYEYGWRS